MNGKLNRVVWVTCTTSPSAARTIFSTVGCGNDNIRMGLSFRRSYAKECDIPSARRIGDKLIVLHEGKIIAQGTAAELDRSSDKVVQQFMNLTMEREVEYGVHK